MKGHARDLGGLKELPKHGTNVRTHILRAAARMSRVSPTVHHGPLRSVFRGPEKAAAKY